MPSRLARPCARRLESGGKLLIPFLTAGFPDQERFLDAAMALVGCGADILEVGIPFTDPLADGPTLQRTSQVALEQGTNLSGVLDLLAETSSRIGIPIVIMTYLNPIHRIGFESFCKKAAEAGVAGVLITDLPPDEDETTGRTLRDHDLDRIILIAPTTRPSRIDRLVQEASGFVYCLTRTGITGAGGGFSSLLAEQVARIRSTCTLPIVAGFGIRSIDDVKCLRNEVDGVVIGAKIAEILGEAATAQAFRSKVTTFLQPIRELLGPS